MASGGEQKLPEQASTGRFIVGVDEAGRGPVLGPLVYAAVGVHSDDAGSLEGSELADSKQLGVAKREELAEKLEGDERFFTATVVLTPACISAGMLGRRRRSLNDMSFEATERALAKLQNKSVGLDELYVDTLGDPAHHADRLKRSFPASHCVAESKADSKYAIVAAASIVAKTSRDSLLGSWRFVEPVDPSTPSLGSGYPGDPNTQAWLHRNVNAVFGFPSLVRFSWSTAQRILDSHALPVKWQSDVPEEHGHQATLEGAAKRARSDGEGEGTKRSATRSTCRHSFFRARSLERVAAL